MRALLCNLFPYTTLFRSAAAGLSDLRVRVFSKLISGPMLHVQSERRGALVSRVTSDIQTVQEFTEWGGVVFVVNRSEEHTSELQSRENIVCRLLPDKKNQ